MSISIGEIEIKLQNNQEIDPYDEILVVEVLNAIINRAQGIIISKIYEIDDDSDPFSIKLDNELTKYMKMKPRSVELLKENIETIKTVSAKIKNKDNFIAEIEKN